MQHSIHFDKKMCWITSIFQYWVRRYPTLTAINDVTNHPYQLRAGLQWLHRHLVITLCEILQLEVPPQIFHLLHSYFDFRKHSGTYVKKKKKGLI